MGAIRGLCTDVIWIDEGKVVDRGPSARVAEKYLRATIKHSGSSICLTDVQRAGGAGRRLRITGVEFNDGTPIYHGETLKVRIQFETTAVCEKVGFGFGFSSAEGIRVMSVDSDLSEVQRDLPKDYVGVLEAQVPTLQLQPDRYLLDVGARSGNNSTLDYLPGCTQIEVLPGPTTPALIIRETGGMRIPAQWEWQASAQSAEQTFEKPTELAWKE
ncbi:MAG: Wzt carbohydrate-binding domain-containing protein [Pyrinomonadaceae bacterium]